MSGFVFVATNDDPLDAICARVAAEPIGSGNGNQIINWAGYRFGQEGATLPDAYERIGTAVAAWAHPDPTARRTIKSGWTAGSKNADEPTEDRSYHEQTIARMRELSARGSSVTSGEEAPAGPVNIVEYRKTVPETVPWIIQPLLYQGGVTLISGPPKAGKSTLGAQIQHCLETRESFLDELTPFERPCLLVTEESGVAVVYKTVDLEKLDVFDWATGGGRSLEDTLNVVAAWVDAHPTGVVFIDTLSMWAGIDDENDASKVTKAIGTIKRLASNWDVAVVLVHHSRKSAGAHGEAIRGSGAMLATVDISAELKRTGDDGSTDRYLELQGRVIFSHRLRLAFDKDSKRYSVIEDKEPSKNWSDEDEARVALIPADGDGLTTGAIFGTPEAVWGKGRLDKQLASYVARGRVRKSTEEIWVGRAHGFRYWGTPPVSGASWTPTDDEE